VNAEVGSRNAEQQGQGHAPRDLQLRTKQFAVAIMRLVDTLPRTRAGDVLGKQLLRAGTSVAANYRAARRARSRKEFVAKMGIVEEESDECCGWLELLVDYGMVRAADSDQLRDEAHQLVAITVSSIRPARGPRTAVPRSAFRVPR
jgi:four helix bundle protein